jgi:hypothetical protein
MFIYYLVKFKWLIAGVSAVITVTAGIFVITNNFENKGYNKAVAEFQSAASTQIKKATDEAIIKANKEMQSALNKQHAIFASELKRAKEEKEVKIEYQKVVEYVDKIKIDSTCISLDSSVVGLLNSSISNSNISSN